MGANGHNITLWMTILSQLRPFVNLFLRLTEDFFLGFLFFALLSLPRSFKTNLQRGFATHAYTYIFCKSLTVPADCPLKFVKKMILFYEKHMVTEDGYGI
jgi:hypothetical protein